MDNDRPSLHLLQPILPLKKRHSAYALSQPPEDIVVMATPTPSTRRPPDPVPKREDITPWEYQNTPPSHFAPATVRSRVTLPTGFVEDVVPWELYPAPDLPEPSPRKSKHLRAGRPLSSSGPNKELGIVGRRKLTAPNKSPAPPRAKPTITSSSSSSLPSRPSVQQQHHHQPQPLPHLSHAPITSDAAPPESSGYSSAPSTSTTFIQPPSPETMPRTPIFLTLKKTPSTSKLEHARLNGSRDAKFSTADRRILQEINLTRNARDAHFLKKGKSVNFGGNGAVPGKKFHPFSQREVPYPRNYEKDVLDLDVWETAFCHDACGSVTWHVFKTPPTRVLDLGCGTGSWTLNCARVWKDCHFVGLDIVPLQPDLSQIGSPDLASRIAWVHANFLDRLPFPDEEFDYVHVKRIALGVPEDKWDSLLEEITRVMKPGAAFELIEEDLFFPGKHVDSDSESDTESEEACGHMSSPSEGEAQPSVPQDELFVTPRPDSPRPVRETTIVEAEELEGDAEVRDYEVVRLPPTSASSHATTIRPPLHVKTSQESWRHSNSRPPFPKRSSSTLSLPTSKNGVSPIKPLEGKALSADPNLSRAPVLPMPVPVVEEAPSEPPELSMPPQKPPNNPRDHWILERIYSEMLASRFINASPLSLLANSLGLYFRDLRTHPAIQFTFPPLPSRRHRLFGKVDEIRKPEEAEEKQRLCLSSDEETTEYDTEMDERPKVLSMQALFQNESRYVCLDETRPPAFSPSSRVAFPESSGDLKITAVRRGSRLPNTQLHLNLKTLNLHLALRTEEVLACSESMWEWVFEEQKKLTPNSPEERNRLMRTQASMSSSESGRGYESFREKIADMTRDEFDDLVNNFRFDMQDQYALSHALTNRFNWSISLCQPPPDRITFDAACEKWKKWERQARQMAAMRSSRSLTYTRSRAISSGNLSHVSSTTSTAPSPQVARAHSGRSAQTRQGVPTLMSGHSGTGSTLVPPISEWWDQNSQHYPFRLTETKNVSGHDANGGESATNAKNGRPRGSSCTTQVPPTTRLSRALKVFVGWKP